MTLLQLRYFHAACRHNSITRAAKALHVSQPSVSSAVKELEKEFGVPLFIRQYRGFALTQCGKQLFDLAGDLIGHADRVLEIMRDAGDRRNIIRLGVPPMIGTFLFPEIYKQFHAAYPSCTLLTTESGTRALLEELDAETLDLAILPSNNIPADKYRIAKLLESETVYCVSRLHPLAGRTRISIPEIGQEPLVMFNHGFFQNEVVEQRFGAYGLRPNVVHYTGQFYTLQRFISDNIATGFMMYGGAVLSPDVVPISLDRPILIDISLVSKRTRHMYSDALHFIRFCREAYAANRIEVPALHASGPHAEE